MWHTALRLRDHCPLLYVTQGLADERIAEVAIQIETQAPPLKITRWTANRHVLNQMRRTLDDYLYDLDRSQGLAPAPEELDRLTRQIVEVARARDRHM